MGFNIVLIEPEIPNNTGNIGRLTLASGSTLHLVKPFGFEITDARLKRAGLDYWQHINIVEYENVDAFFAQHADKTWDIPFEEDMFLVFGKESVGLSKEITDAYPSDLYKIPLYSDKIRSLNLGNAVGIVTYEGLRQLNSQK